MELPNEVFVFVEDNVRDEEYLSAEETLEACAEKGRTRVVGVYELKKKVSVRLEVREELVVTEGEEQ